MLQVSFQITLSDHPIKPRLATMTEQLLHLSLTTSGRCFRSKASLLHLYLAFPLRL